MKYFDILTDRQWDLSFGFGAHVYGHKHIQGATGWHLHIEIDILFWYIEVRLLNDEPETEV